MLPIEAVDSAGAQKLLKSSDAIFVFDRESNSHVQLWGQYSVSKLCPPGQPAHVIKQVEIEVDLTADVERARAAVERAKRN